MASFVDLPFDALVFIFLRMTVRQRIGVGFANVNLLRAALRAQQELAGLWVAVWRWRARVIFHARATLGIDGYDFGGQGDYFGWPAFDINRFPRLARYDGPRSDLIRGARRAALDLYDRGGLDFALDVMYEFSGALGVAEHHHPRPELYHPYDDIITPSDAWEVVWHQAELVAEDVRSPEVEDLLEDGYEAHQWHFEMGDPVQSRALWRGLSNGVLRLWMYHVYMCIDWEDNSDANPDDFSDDNSE